MPDTRLHRGPHPKDKMLFGRDKTGELLKAAADFSWLLSRQYSADSALQLVGDRYRLEKRQRAALARACCSDAAKARRAEKRCSPDAIAGQTLLLDGFNILTTLEAVLSGGLALRCRDGATRDLASVHGTWRRVRETDAALTMLGRTVDSLRPHSCCCYLDRPVSNSGRLRAAIEAQACRWSSNWSVEVVNNPDKTIVQSSGIALTADSAILDACTTWFNVVDYILACDGVPAWVIDFSLC